MGRRTWGAGHVGAGRLFAGGGGRGLNVLSGLKFH